MSGHDPRQSTEYLLQALRRGPLTRAALRATAGPAWPLLLRQLERDRHVLRFDRPRKGGDWWRVRLIYEAAPACEPGDEQPEQFALDVGGSAPPTSAVFGLEDAAA